MFWSIIKPGNASLGNEVTTAWGRCEQDHDNHQMTVIVEGGNDPSLIGQSLLFGFEWLDSGHQRTRYWQILPCGKIGRQGTAVKR
jgi:ribulose bisphosphate carboxylase small subunit